MLRANTWRNSQITPNYNWAVKFWNFSLFPFFSTRVIKSIIFIFDHVLSHFLHSLDACLLSLPIVCVCVISALTRLSFVLFINLKFVLELSYRIFYEQDRARQNLCSIFLAFYSRISGCRYSWVAFIHIFR